MCHRKCYVKFGLETSKSGSGPSRPTFDTRTFSLPSLMFCLLRLQLSRLSVFPFRHFLHAEIGLASWHGPAWGNKCVTTSYIELSGWLARGPAGWRAGCLVGWPRFTNLLVSQEAPGLFFCFKFTAARKTKLCAFVLSRFSLKIMSPYFVCQFWPWNI